METNVRLKRGHAVKGGVVAGLIGGAILALVLLVAALAARQDVWIGLKAAGAPLLGERALEPGFDLTAVLTGVLGHFAVAIVWGVLFAVLFYGLSPTATVAVGALWGLGVWIGMSYVVLPLVGLSELARAAPVGVAIVEHVIFGLALAIGFLPFQRTRPRAATTVSSTPILH